MKDLLANLIALLNQSGIDEVKWFSTHAAVLGLDNLTIAFPADSGNGKSTLAAAAVLAGYSYVSDEALVLDADGKVVPYPKPMALSAWSCAKLGLISTGKETLFTAEELGGSAHTESSLLTDLVIGHYGANDLTLQARPSSEAVAQLIGKSFNHYKDPERAFRLATATARSIRVWRLDYDDPAEAVAVLAERLQAHDPPTT